MRKVITICITLALVLSLAPAAFADVDLSGMTFDELVALRDQIDLAIWNSQEWQEVEVPQGVWRVGEDIPAGKWTIRAVSGGNAYVKVGNELKDGGTDVKSKYTLDIYAPDHRYYTEGKNMTEGTAELEAGQYVSINYANAVFTPYAGKPSLGFK